MVPVTPERRKRKRERQRKRESVPLVSHRLTTTAGWPGSAATGLFRCHRRRFALRPSHRLTTTAGWPGSAATELIAIPMVGAGAGAAHKGGQSEEEGGGVGAAHRGVKVKADISREHLGAAEW